MTDSALSLQKAIVGQLRKWPAVTQIVGARSYDGAPAAPQKPYVSIGPVSSDTERAECYDGADVELQLDGWSAGPESVEIKRLGKAIAAAMVALDADAELQLEDNQRLVQLTVERIQYLREPDGLTQHAVVTLRARTEPIT